jgi:hypothetical protein
LQRRRSLGLDRGLLRAGLTYALNLSDPVGDEVNLVAGESRRFSRFMGLSYPRASSRVNECTIACGARVDVWSSDCPHSGGELRAVLGCEVLRQRATSPRTQGA